MKTVGFQAGEILLPRCDLEKWSVVACDQFTSQPEYWDKAIHDRIRALLATLAQSKE